jgi:hypothetical protein
MNTWAGLGIFFLGAAAGALPTAIAYQGQIQKLRAEIESQIAYGEKRHDEDEGKTKAARA